MPIYIQNDWVYWALAVLMAYSSGYLRYFFTRSFTFMTFATLFGLPFSSLGMMYAPQTVAPQNAQTAGMFAAAMLITGIFSGITFSMVFPIIVQKISW